ncbi:unnamed protein product [Sphagnum tenellum]
MTARGLGTSPSENGTAINQEAGVTQCLFWKKQVAMFSQYRKKTAEEEKFKSPTFGVGLEVSAREIGGKTLVPLLNELLLNASESSSATDLKSASAFETASKLTANGIATLGTLDLNKFSGGLKNVSKPTVEGTGLHFAGFSEGGLQPYFRSKSRDVNLA